LRSGPVGQRRRGDAKGLTGAGQVGSQLVGAVSAFPQVHLGDSGGDVLPGERQRLTSLGLGHRQVGQRRAQRRTEHLGQLGSGHSVGSGDRQQLPGELRSVQGSDRVSGLVLGADVGDADVGRDALRDDTALQRRAQRPGEVVEQQGGAQHDGARQDLADRLEQLDASIGRQQGRCGPAGSRCCWS
jgi:hypothetical protein